MNEDVKSTGVHIHSRADELISCLEGEIAKRDTRIVELEDAAESLRISRDYHHEQEVEYRRRWAAIYAAPVVNRKFTTECKRCLGTARVDIGTVCDNWVDCPECAAAPEAPAADAVLTASEWTKDAVEWGGALNYAAWEFVNECPEKSALLFNNTKGPLRAAIMKYAEIVAANAKDSSHD